MVRLQSVFRVSGALESGCMVKGVSSDDDGVDSGDLTLQSMCVPLSGHKFLPLWFLIT